MPGLWKAPAGSLRLSALAGTGRILQRSKIKIYLHLVWTTHGRAPWILPELERDLYRCIGQEAVRFGCEVLALNGMPDHVHVIVRFPATVALSKLLQAMKGTSSHFARDNFPRTDVGYGWQDNYAAFGISPSQLQKAIEYVQNQKQRHAKGKLWNSFEQTHEEIPQSCAREGT